MTDHFDWFGALKASATEARELTPQRTLHPVVQCRCGALEDQGRDLGEPRDLRGMDVDLTTNTLWQLIECLVCRHPIGRLQPCVVASGPDYPTRLPHFHPECAVI